MWNEHLFIVFAIEHYNPLGVIRVLGFEGIHPDYIAIKGRVELSSHSKYINKCHRVNSVEEGYKILVEQYSNVYEKTGKKPFIFCSDDKTIGYLDLRYDELKDKFILYNAGKQGRINEFMDKYKILECAKHHGLNVLDSKVVKRGEDPGDITYPIITKAISPNSGGWKSDVFICKNFTELKEAYKKIKSEEVMLQTYIDKKNEYCIEGCSVNKGKDVLYSIYSTYNYIVKGYYSPYRTTGSFHNPELKKSLDGMMSEIGFEGIFDVEFLVAEDDTLWFLEINFRNTTWSYASACAGMPLAPIWSKSMLEGRIIDGAFKNTKPFKAMVEPIDYNLRVRKGNLGKLRWLKEMLQCKCLDYFNWKDLKPSFMMLKNWKCLG